MSTPIEGLKNDHETAEVLSASGWVNPVADLVDRLVGSLSSVNASGSGEDTLTDEQYNPRVVRFTGELTGSRSFVFPNHTGRWWILCNDTTGEFPLSCKADGESGVVIPPDAKVFVFYNGTDLEIGLSESLEAPTHGNEAHDPEFATEADLSAHAGATDNPHEVTKSHVGLGNVENLGIATEGEAEEGTSNVKYMTPLRTAQAIAELAEGGVDIPIVTTTEREALEADAGDIVYDSDLNSLMVYNGEHWDFATEPDPLGLTDAATVETDASKGNHFRLTTASSRVLGAPSNPRPAQAAIWEITNTHTSTITITLADVAGGFLQGRVPSTQIPDGTIGILAAYYNEVLDRWVPLGFLTEGGDEPE